MDSYYLTAHTVAGGSLMYCKPCSSSCRTCQVDQPAVCLSCWPNAFLTGTSCTKCNSSCITCAANAPNSCTSCAAGKILNLNTNTCDNTNENSTCGQNCGNCRQSSGSTNQTCTLCLPGYVLQGGNCVQCPAGCSVCTLNSGSNIPSCSICTIGYFYNSIGLTCEKCGGTWCASCTNASVCTACMTGYTLSNTGSCEITCAYPCSSC